MNIKHLLIFMCLQIVSLSYGQLLTSKKPQLNLTYTDKEIVINFYESINIIDYKIINITGETIYKVNVDQINTKKIIINNTYLKPGMYFILITTNKSIYTAKFVKK